MPEDAQTREVPVWTLAPQEVSLPSFSDTAALTSERLDHLRSALAAFADAPIATLEAHPLSESIDRTQGTHFANTSPLARHLAQLAGQASDQIAKSSIGSGGEVLYRMALPAKVAAQVGSGLQPMTAKAGGIHSALVDRASRIRAQARFVPVMGGIGGVGALTIAGPLMVAAVGAYAAVQADQRQQQAIRHVTELLEKLHQDQLDAERNKLEACQPAIKKASAILLDRGLLGEALGLGPAVLTIEEAVVAARRRIGRWRRKLDGLRGDRVELNKLRELLPGFDDFNSDFYAHIELARTAVAMKRQVAVLQAVEQAQLNTDNKFERFVEVLKDDQGAIEEVDAKLHAVLLRLSRLELDRSHGVRDFVFSSGEVDALLQASRHLRTLGESIAVDSPGTGDVEIEMIREKNGSVVVFPGVTAA